MGGARVTMEWSAGSLASGDVEESKRICRSMVLKLEVREVKENNYIA